MKGCPYTFPCCGGWCAPTVSPEKSCLKHVSNEYTLPANAKFVKCAPVVETSCCCRACGSIGCRVFDKHRNTIFVAVACMNFFLAILNLMAAMGSSTNPDQVEKFYWSRGEVTDKDRGDHLTLYVGVSMRVDVADCSDAVNVTRCTTIYQESGFVIDGSVLKREVEWSNAEACATMGDEVLQACEECQDAAIARTTLILAVLTQFPTILTDLQRSTRFGDVNCQACLGFISNVFSWSQTITSVAAWGRACFRNMPDDVNGNPVEWSLGITWNLLFISTVCKLIDAAAHLMVPAPRRGPVQKGMETPDYLALACKDSPEVDDEFKVTLGKESEADQVKSFS